jgi:predicted glycosyltransferase
MFRRILTYSHDSYGLGHLRRTLTIAEHLLAAHPEATVLSVTGSPRSHSFKLPPRLDYVKLPAVTKDEGGAYVARELDLPLPEIVGLRSSLILSCARAYRPDLVLVDHAPAGLGGEIVPLLESLSGTGTKVVLGLRDVIDEPTVVRKAWLRENVFGLLEEHYDAILLHGERGIFDPVPAYGIPKDVGQRLIETGYVARGGSGEDATATRARWGVGGRPLAVVAAGGGGDGHRMMLAWLRGLRRVRQARDLATIVVTGPLMSPGKRAKVAELAARCHDVQVVDFTPDLPDLWRAADVAVSMGGYNSVAEILLAGTPCVIVPRVRPRLEQWIRAKALEARGLVATVDPDTLTPERLVESALVAMASGRGGPNPRRPRMDGAEGVRRALQAMSAPASDAGSVPRASAR